MTDVDADAPTDVDMLAFEHVDDANEAQVGSISDVELVAASEDRADGDMDPETTAMQFDPPLIPSRENSSVPFSALGEVLHEKAVRRNGLAVVVPAAQNRWEFKVFEEDAKVVEILEEYDDAGFVEYLVLFADGSEDVVSLPSIRLSLQHIHYNLTLNIDVFYICTSLFPLFYLFTHRCYLPILFHALFSP